MNNFNIVDEINLLLNNINNDEEYFILNYNYFYDYYKIICIISEDSILRYNPSEETKNFIEITTTSNIITGVFKIPILKTNIKSYFYQKIYHNFIYTKYNNGVILLSFSNNNFKTKYSYSSNIKAIEYTNNDFFSLNINDHQSNDISVEKGLETENEDDENYDLNEDEVVVNKSRIEPLDKLNIVLEENTTIDSQNKLYKFINDYVIKNVICYTNIEFENLKDIFKKLGSGKIKIVIKNGIMCLSAIVIKNDKKVNVEQSIIYTNEEYINQEISFYINSNSISKLKSLTSNFNIMENDDKKIFKYIEIKIVLDKRNESNTFGITIFPSNFKQESRIKNNIDIYNSIMLYIPDYK